MKLVRIGENAEIKRRDTGEHFCVLIGRHEQHGSTKNHTIAMVELDPGATSEPHLHKAREESYFVISGTGIAKVGDELAEIHAGDLVYASPGQRHSFKNTGAVPLRYLVITAPGWSPDDSHR